MMFCRLGFTFFPSVHVACWIQSKLRLSQGRDGNLSITGTLRYMFMSSRNDRSYVKGAKHEIVYMNIVTNKIHCTVL